MLNVILDCFGSISLHPGNDREGSRRPINQSHAKINTNHAFATCFFPGLSVFGLYMSTLSFHRLVVIVCLFFFSKSTLNFTEDGANILAY